jgi:hypothetical protein
MNILETAADGDTMGTRIRIREKVLCELDIRPDRNGNGSRQTGKVQFGIHVGGYGSLRIPGVDV